MSTSIKELKQQHQGPPATPLEPTPPVNLVGKTVAFAIFPFELVPAKVTAYYDEPASADRPEVKAIDYEFIEHSATLVDTSGANADGLIEHRMVPVQRTVEGKRARWSDPCVRADGGRLAAPQSGHFVPGTWFDPSPYTVRVDCIKDEVPEVRGIPKVPGTLGRVLQAASPGKHVTEGPFDDFAAAYTAYRAAKPQYDTVILLFARKPRT